ncbi:MAG: hypothetical protein EOL87_03705 [Spartobacteria bacterium]|nr:hypothetical protein [Spartobacteria bacterium]
MTHLKGFRRIKRGVLVFDGEHWHIGIFQCNRRHSKPLETHSITSRNMKQLPTAVLDYLSEQQVMAVRLLLPADLHSLPMEMPEDVEHEELHTALAYEMAEEMGTAAHMLRLATVEASVYGMGCDAGVYIMAGFDTRQIEGYANQLKQIGIGFEGVGALELGALALHTQYAEERLLILRFQSGFYAVPGMEGQPFYMTSVQTGLKPEETSRDKERLIRLQRRLQTANHVPLRVITATADGIPAKERVLEVVQETDKISTEALDDLMPALMQQVLNSRIGNSEMPCPLIGPPPAPKDPHRSGTWICIGLVLLTLVYLGTRWYYIHCDLLGEQKRAQAWQVLVSKREQTANLCSSLKKSRNEQNRIYHILTETNRLPDGVIAVIDVLSTSIPQYTRITRFKQVGPHQFTIEGTTRWAKGKIKLDRILTEALLTVNMLAEPGPMEYDKITREQVFSYNIMPIGVYK